MTHNKNWLQNYNAVLNPPELFGVGNDEKPITILGDGILPIKIKDGIIGIHAFFAPGEDATILSASKLWNENKITLSKGYKRLIGPGIDIPTHKIENTLWVNKNDSISCKPKTKTKLRAVRPLNPKYSNVRISTIEAHLRLNHLPLEVIKKSITNEIFADVSKLIKSKNGHWCEICTAGKITRHFHYTGSMNHYSKQKLPGSSWSVDTFGPVAHAKDKYMVLMIDSVSKYMIVSFHSTKKMSVVGQQIEYNINWAEKQFQIHVKELIMDKGTEYNNSYTFM